MEIVDPGGDRSNQEHNAKYTGGNQSTDYWNPDCTSRIEERPEEREKCENASGDEGGFCIRVKSKPSGMRIIEYGNERNQEKINSVKHESAEHTMGD